MVEYVLALVLAAGIAMMVERMTKNGIRALWRRMAADIAAACPPGQGCYKPEAIPDP